MLGKMDNYSLFITVKFARKHYPPSLDNVAFVEGDFVRYLDS